MEEQEKYNVDEIANLKAQLKALQDEHALLLQHYAALFDGIAGLGALARSVLNGRPQVRNDNRAQ